MLLSKNEKEVLSIVRKKGIVAINDIVKSCDLSIATGSRIINKLITEKFLTETDEDNPVENMGKGRPQRYVKWNCPNYYVIGIDVGTTRIKGSIFNLNLDFIKEIDIETNPKGNVKQIFSKINEMIDRLYDTNIIDKKQILGIGIAFAGMINKNDKIIKFSPAFNWYDVDVTNYITNKTGLPIYFENVTRLMSLSESYFGFGKELDNFIFINIGFGIGSSAVINGSLFTGQHGYAGEFGHTITEPESKIECSCGQYGCLTTTSSGEYIAKKFLALMQSGEKTILSQEKIEKIDTKLIFDAAINHNDTLSISVIDYALKNMAIRIADLNKCFDPQAIIIGGGVSWNGKYFFSNLQKKLNKLHMKYNKEEEVLIYPQTFPRKATLIGAGIMVAQYQLNL
ncbi:MAG: hypothetical protein RL662_2058 [Bacteroidota bacterium]|jgi:glucokinase-like ROK family protein